ncbi:MAG: hypothetical protein GYA24_21340 [Candidatus Lokiarchaeota archaeon]|nr:hypothetical protein [Candidatus Lokiarchaeota archaeon]
MSPPMTQNSMKAFRPSRAVHPSPVHDPVESTRNVAGEAWGDETREKGMTWFASDAVTVRVYMTLMAGDNGS